MSIIRSMRIEVVEAPANGEEGRKVRCPCCGRLLLVVMRMESAGEVEVKCGRCGRVLRVVFRT